jgi:hypothetical protein
MSILPLLFEGLLIDQKPPLDMIFVTCCHVKAIEILLAPLSIVLLQSLYVTAFASHPQTFPNPKSAILAMWNTSLGISVNECSER